MTINRAGWAERGGRASRAFGQSNLEGAPISGYVASGFEAVRGEFEQNFRKRGEVGASVCVTVDGKPVVDLWGGFQDSRAGIEWKGDTLVLLWSGTKAAVAVCSYLLMSHGALHFDRPIADIWPEFGHAGKQHVTVRMALSHTAGLPAIRRRLPPQAFYDWEYMVKALERERAFWEPGTQHGYHTFTLGWILGEVIRRLTGMSVGQFFRQMVADPAGLDLWIGLPPELEKRVAPFLVDLEADDSPFARTARSHPRSTQALAIYNTGGYLDNEEYNSPRSHVPEVPSANGIGNARALARMYGLMASGGHAGGPRFLEAGHVSTMARIESVGELDTVLLAPTRFSAGFMKSFGERNLARRGDCLVLSDAAFGHTGLGGSAAFADPGARLSFAYTMSLARPGFGVDERGQSLIDATYGAIGYRMDQTIGRWVPSEQRSRRAAGQHQVRGGEP